MYDISIRRSYASQVVFYAQGEHTLWINGRNVIAKTGFKIISPAVFQNAVVIVIETPDLHEKSVADSYQENRSGNLLALDNQGELLWRYDDIANTPLHFPFSGGYIASARDRKSFSKWFQIPFVDTHEYFIGLNNADGHFIIDVTTGKLIAEKTFRS